MADAEFGDAVVAFLREQGWTLSTQQLASGVFLVGGKRGDSEQLFALVGSSPSTPLTRDHVEYLCKAVERESADRAVAVPREALSQEARQFADEHGVTVLARDAIRSTTQGTDDDDGDDSAVSLPRVVTTRRAVVAGSLALGGLAVGGATASQVFDGVSIGGLVGAGTGTPEDGPETVVREYLRAVAHGDEDAARALVHEDSNHVDDDQLSATELTVHEVAQRDLRTLLNSTGDLDEAELDAEVQSVEAELDSLLADAGASDYGLVVIDVTTPDYPERTKSIALTVRDDGEWFVYDTSIGLGTSEATEPTVTATDRPSRALRVTTTAGAVTDDDRVGTVTLVVGTVPGIDEVDLRETTVQWMSSSGGYSLTFGDSATAETFSVTPVADENDSLPTLDAPSDRAELAFDSVAITGAGLPPEATVALRLTTALGDTTDVDLTVPATLGDSEYVEL